MKERPILFSGEMVRAILEGRKTQTRRVVKWAGRDYSQYENLVAVSLENYPHAHASETTGIGIPSEGGVVQIMGKCPYGKPGDRLWVRETTYAPLIGQSHVMQVNEGLLYAADVAHRPSHYKTVSSIHMPRWASRITLEIVSVRVERLQDISANDARAEGVFCPEALYAQNGESAPVAVFYDLWESINGKTHPWESNPWVWVIEFKVVKQ